MYHHIATKTQVTESIFQLTQIHSNFCPVWERLQYFLSLNGVDTLGNMGTFSPGYSEALESNHLCKF